MRYSILQVVAFHRPDDHHLRVSSHHVVEETVHNGILGFEHVEISRYGGTPAGIIGRNRVNARHRHRDGGGCRTVAPKVGLRGRFGDRSERHGGVRAEEMRAGNNDIRRCTHRQIQGVRTGTPLSVGVFVNINPITRVG